MFTHTSVAIGDGYHKRNQYNYKEISLSNSEFSLVSVMGSVPIKYQKGLIRVIYMTNVTVKETESGLSVHTSL